MKEKYLTVSSLTKYLKYKFDTDDNLRKVFLKGEISNFKAHTTGHYYFSIKDDKSKILAIMFAGNTKKLKFMPTEGMKVLVTGSISVYAGTGSYQIYVDDIIEDGTGNLYTAFLQLKEKLSKENLFSKEHKLAIPKYPKKIGIITASTGAAVRDILFTIQRRYPICETYLFPALVQGNNAPTDINNKLEQALKSDLDLIILGRGGGSFEDLNAFNDETLARTIYNAKIPIISAVGHEVDFAISDFVSDLRASTPTAAAELAVPNIVEEKKLLHQYTVRATESLLKKVKLAKLTFESIKNSYVIKNPMIMYDNSKQKIDLLNERLNKIFVNNYNIYKNKLLNIKNSYVLTYPKNIYSEKQKKLNNIIEKLQLINPLNILSKGYSLAYVDNKLIKSIKQVKVKDTLEIKLVDGKMEVSVNTIGGKND